MPYVEMSEVQVGAHVDMSRLPSWYSVGAEVSGLPQLAGSCVLPSSATQSARMMSVSVPAPTHAGQASWQQQ